MFHRRRASEITQDSMAAALSSLDLGVPERVARASAKADGATTPIVRHVESLFCSATGARVHNS